MFQISYFEKLFDEAKQHDLDDSKFCYTFWTFIGVYNVLFNHFYKNAKSHLFGKNLSPIPSDYDTILKSYYGDYMTPPSETQKDTNQIHEIFIEEESG